MDVKKNPKINLNKFRIGLLFMGLAFAGAVCLSFIEFGQINKEVYVAKKNDEGSIKLVPYIPPPPPEIEPDEPEPEPEPELEEPEDEPAVNDQVKEAENKEDIKKNVETTRKPPPKKKKKKKKAKVYDFPQQEATFPGGMEAMYGYLSGKISYPKQAKAAGIQGKVFVEFEVGVDGKVSKVKILKGIGGGCDEEAMRVIQSLPAWTPAEQGGNKVIQRFKLPVFFKLE